MSTIKGNFLSLLLGTSRKQALGLLKSVSDEQVKILSEILVNFLRGNLPASKESLKKYKSIIRQIGHNPKRLKFNKCLISGNAGKLYKILLLLKPSLMKIMS